jgi:hypothetical protein
MMLRWMGGGESGDFFHGRGGSFGDGLGQAGPLRDREGLAGMDAAAAVGVVDGDVVAAEMVLDDAAAGGLLGAREAGPEDEKTLAADGATDVAAGVRQSTEDWFHGAISFDGHIRRITEVAAFYCKG